MKKLSLQNAQTTLSRKEMKAISGGYDINVGGYTFTANPVGYVVGVVIDYLVNTVATAVYEGAKQSANAQVNGGTQVIIPGGGGTTSSIWVDTKK